MTASWMLPSGDRLDAATSTLRRSASSLNVPRGPR